MDTCGNCSSGEIIVAEVLVQPGERVERDQPVLTIESDKTALEIPATRLGVVQEVLVTAGERVGEGMPLVALRVPDPG